MPEERTAYNNRDENHVEILFEEIFRKYEAGLYLLCLRLTKSDLYAKDIIQEVFLKLWQHRSELATIRNIQAWLYRTTENKIIDLLRKAAADTRLRDTLWNSLTENTTEPETILVIKEYDKTIRKAIDQLPPQRKLIYCLNKEEGKSYAEIAEELSISRHTVKNQLTTALQSIRRFFSASIRMF
jgi:RNA polymerase sigma-70 factor (family 1)